MNYFEYVNRNINRVKYEVEEGHVYTSAINHYAVYCRYDLYRKQGNSVSKAAFFASEDLKISERSVMKIKKQMERTIKKQLEEMA